MTTATPTRPTGSRLARAARAAALATLLMLFSIGLVVAAFEIGLRLTGHEAIYEMYSKPSAFWEHDELLGWRHQPGARGEYVGPRPWPVEFRAQVEINSLGLRGPEIPPPAPEELRVLFLGDSMVASFEVEYEQSFVARLEGRLREQLGVPVRAINAGIRGYGTDQTYLYFREHGWGFAPDLVVFFHSGNDPSDNTTLHEMRRPFGKPAFSLREDGELELLGAPVPRYPMCSEVVLADDYSLIRVDTALSRLLCRAQMALFDHSALFSYVTLAIPWDAGLLRSLYYVGNPHVDQLTRAVDTGAGKQFEGRLTTRLLESLADEVRRRGAGFLVIGYPRHLDQIDQKDFAPGEVSFLPLEEIDGRRDLQWHHDSHLNPDGHAALAALLLEPIESRLRARIEAGHVAQEPQPRDGESEAEQALSSPERG